MKYSTDNDSCGNADVDIVWKQYPTSDCTVSSGYNSNCIANNPSALGAESLSPLFIMSMGVMLIFRATVLPVFLTCK